MTLNVQNSDFVKDFTDLVKEEIGPIFEVMKKINKIVYELRFAEFNSPTTFTTSVTTITSYLEDDGEPCTFEKDVFANEISTPAKKFLTENVNAYFFKLFVGLYSGDIAMVSNFTASKYKLKSL